MCQIYFGTSSVVIYVAVIPAAFDASIGRDVRSFFLFRLTRCVALLLDWVWPPDILR